MIQRPDKPVFDTALLLLFIVLGLMVIRGSS